MLDRAYKKETLFGKYLDPLNEFKQKDVACEIRQDEITGVTCRVLTSRYRIPVKPDLRPYLEISPESKCPFCPDLFEKMTPKFTYDVAPEGRIKRGDAYLFPNAFPHDRFNCVALFSQKHFIGLSDLTPEIMENGFLVCRDYFKRMKEADPALRFCSINWNYMPPAGGGLIHPHVQTVLSENPTRFMARLSRKASDYREERGGNLWKDLVAKEKELGERFIASSGTIAWLASFAPQGMVGEIWFAFTGKKSIFELQDNDFRELLKACSCLFRFFDEKNFVSFNLSLFATLEESDDLCVQGRLMPRCVILPLGTSDVNYFEKFHDEVLCTVVPEEMCRELKGFLSGISTGIPS